MPRARLFALAAFTFAAGCEDQAPLDRVERNAYFIPPMLDFGSRPIGDHSLPVQLGYSGGETRQIRDVVFDPPPADDAFGSIKSEGGGVRGSFISGGMPLSIDVLYAPRIEGAHDTTMVVDFGDTEARLPILASAHALSPPVAAVRPTSISFGTVEIGRDATQMFEVENTGDTSGALSAQVAAPFAITDSLGVFAPGEKRTLALHYRPTAAGSAAQDIELALGTGPRAMLSASGTAIAGGTLQCTPPSLDFADVPRGTTARRTTTCSATGGPYTLADLVFLPAGSPFRIGGAPLLGSMVTTMDLTVELAAAGLARRYNAALEVKAAHGPTTSIALTANVTPPPAGANDLSVRLAWNTDRTDFDLHLVRDGGSPYAMTHDCYFENKHADWGQPDVEDDDAFLDRDARSGFGPEEINLARASTVYDVYVQYYDFPDELGSAPPTQVEITYQLRGMAQSIERRMTTCGNTWHVGTIRFDGGSPTFQVLDVEVDTWRIRTPDCR